jgi:hypothetical protein
MSVRRLPTASGPSYIPLAGGYPIINTFIDTRRVGEHSGVGPMGVNELDIVVVRKGR